jgi:hypothetical protein
MLEQVILNTLQKHSCGFTGNITTGSFALWEALHPFHCLAVLGTKFGLALTRLPLELHSQPFFASVIFQRMSLFFCSGLGSDHDPPTCSLYVARITKCPTISGLFVEMGALLFAKAGLKQ